jgi:hypothetical protein
MNELNKNIIIYIIKIMSLNNFSHLIITRLYTIANTLIE